MGNNEKIIEILKKNNAGMTYQDVLDRYKEIYGIELKNAYVYLMRLKKKGIINSYPTVDKKGKGFTYKLLEQKENQERNILDTQILKKILPKFIELEVNLKDTIEIEDKRIVELIKECQLI